MPSPFTGAATADDHDRTTPSTTISTLPTIFPTPLVLSNRFACQRAHFYPVTCCWGGGCEKQLIVKNEPLAQGPLAPGGLGGGPTVRSGATPGKRPKQGAHAFNSKASKQSRELLLGIPLLFQLSNAGTLPVTVTQNRHGGRYAAW